jgi:hypothetical protein
MDWDNEPLRILQRLAESLAPKHTIYYLSYEVAFSETWKPIDREERKHSPSRDVTPYFRDIPRLVARIVVPNGAIRECAMVAPTGLDFGCGCGTRGGYVIGVKESIDESYFAFSSFTFSLSRVVATCARGKLDILTDPQFCHADWFMEMAKRFGDWGLTALSTVSGKIEVSNHSNSDGAMCSFADTWFRQFKKMSAPKGCRGNGKLKWPEVIALLNQCPHQLRISGGNVFTILALLISAIRERGLDVRHNEPDEGPTEPPEGAEQKISQQDEETKIPRACYELGR